MGWIDNYPPGMSASDWDHVNGVVRCSECGEELPEEGDHECAERDWDTERELRDEIAYDRRLEEGDLI